MTDITPLTIQWTTQSFNQPWLELRKMVEEYVMYPPLVLRVAPSPTMHYLESPSIDRFSGIVRLYNFADSDAAWCKPTIYNLGSAQPKTRVVAELLFGYAPFNVILDAILEHPECPDWFPLLLPRIVW